MLMLIVNYKEFEFKMLMLQIYEVIAILIIRDILSFILGKHVHQQTLKSCKNIENNQSF